MSSVTENAREKCTNPIIIPQKGQMKTILQTSWEPEAYRYQSETGICQVCQILIKRNGGCAADEDPDPCLGFIPSVRFACCGHGDLRFAYVFFENDDDIMFSENHCFR